jgi:hypothetical protein
LKPTQKNKRTKELNEMKQYAEETVGMTFEQANITRPKLAIHEALQLHQAARNKLRKATKSIRIPSSTTINLELKQWAIEFATETRSFNDPATKLAGAYFNPLKLIEIVTQHNRKFTVSADKGGDWLKIGIIFLNSAGKSQFLCLLVVKCDESIENLNALNTPRLTRFERESANFLNIRDVLQFLLDNKNALYVSDYKLMSIVLAIKQPGNTIYPCPKCLVCVDNLFEKKPVRKNTDKHSRHEYEPWLKIDVNKLVPLPLHVMLGFTNKMIKVARKKLTDSAIDCVIEVIKTNHKRGGGGLSDLKELNGPEIRRWNKKKCFLSLIQYTNDLQVIKM